MFMKSAARVAEPAKGPPGSIRIGDFIIPAGIDSLESFRQWTRSDSFPPRGDFCWLGGVLWVDLSMEVAQTHGLVKTAIASVLHDLAKSNELGEVYTDAMRVSDPKADLSCEPDVLFVSYKSIRDGSIREIAGDSGYTIEFEGSADLIVEIVSDSSVPRDIEDYPDRLYRSGVKEYWIVDARGKEVSFTIMRRGPRGFAKTPLRSGHLHSRVFSQSFKLSRSINKYGRLIYSLATS